MERPMIVLVVDDEPSIRELCASILRGAGFEVSCAADGEEALRPLAPGLDIILTDLGMPDRAVRRRAQLHALRGNGGAGEGDRGVEPPLRTGRRGRAPRGRCLAA
jgi:CheY-like chemotaxis protein